MKATILMGLPLSGKTTWINQQNFDIEIHIISADKIKETHPNYNPDNVTEEVHEWSVAEAEKQILQLIEKKKEFVFDSGSINNHYTIRIINTLKDNLYNVRVVHIKTPYQICIERNKTRTRKVPENNILEKAIRENAQAEKLSQLVTNFTTIDYFTNKNLFVDMDGVIAAMTILPKFNGCIDFVNSEIYLHLKPVTAVLEKLKLLMLMGYKVYILSAIPNSISMEEKNIWLDKHFAISKEKRFFVNQGKHKAEMLDNLVTKLKLNKQDVTLIDDTQSILYDVMTRSMKPMHPSEFLTFNFKSLRSSI
jgi:predicted kinase